MLKMENIATKYHVFTYINNLHNSLSEEKYQGAIEGDSMQMESGSRATCFSRLLYRGSFKKCCDKFTEFNEDYRKTKKKKIFLSLTSLLF